MPPAVSDIPAQTPVYDDALVRRFLVASYLWGAIAMLVGFHAALEMAFPQLSFNSPHHAFGQLRPGHTHIALFGFVANALFAFLTYSTQRLCRTPIYNAPLATLHFLAWQLALGAGLLLRQPLYVPLAVLVLLFAAIFFSTLAHRRVPRLPVPLWFYAASLLGLSLTLLTHLLSPAGLPDALLQWWRSNATLNFLLLVPFLGLLYHILPALAGRPLFSRNLAIVQFWTLLPLCTFAGPHHLPTLAFLDWPATVATASALILLLPLLAAAVNAFATLRGQWDRVAADPILKFLVVAVLFLSLWSVESLLLAVPSIADLVQFTDYPIAHLHLLFLGFAAFLIFAFTYHLVPHLSRTTLWSPRLADLHFWVATAGLLLYVVPVYVAGATQGVMWLSLNPNDTLTYADFSETTRVLPPMYIVRALGGLLFLTGALLAIVNLFKTYRSTPLPTPQPDLSLDPGADLSPPPPQLGVVADVAVKLQSFFSLAWHADWERHPLKLSSAIVVAIILPALPILLPAFHPAPPDSYTPLEAIGRRIYLREGCVNCHTQLVRPLLAETKRYGPYTTPQDFSNDSPTLWGARRLGPDLAHESLVRSPAWHYQHFQNPRDLTPGSLMPAYPWLARNTLPGAPDDQAIAISRAIVAEDVNRNLPNRDTVIADRARALESTEAVALIAYLQTLGKPSPNPPQATSNKQPATTQPAGGSQ